MRSTMFLPVLLLTACRSCQDDPVSASDPGTEASAAEVLAALNITNRCDSLAVRATLAGDVYGCTVETTGYVVWFSDPAQEFGASVLSLVILPDANTCGQDFDALTTLSRGVELHPSDWSKEGDVLSQHGMAESEEDAEARIGIDFSFPQDDVEGMSGSLFYLSGSSKSTYWDGYDAKELLQFSGAEIVPASVDIPGC